MAYDNKMAKLCKDNGIQWNMKDQFVQFFKGNLHASAHVFDDYADTLEVLKRTHMIPQEYK
jgi:alpha-amylase/alpha-mannosidase (GH57 family)